MGNKLKKNRARKAAKAMLRKQAGHGRPPQRSKGMPPEAGQQPTPEREARGCWVKAEGVHIDRAADMLGALEVAEIITPQQHAAGRDWQEARAAYIAELQLSGYRSCLNTDQAGHDESDGNPEAVRHFKALERSVGMLGSAELTHVIEYNQRPRAIQALRCALDAVAGC